MLSVTNCPIRIFCNQISPEIHGEHVCGSTKAELDSGELYTFSRSSSDIALSVARIPSSRQLLWREHCVVCVIRLTIPEQFLDISPSEFTDERMQSASYLEAGTLGSEG